MMFMGATHRFVILGQDILTLDTKAERDEAARVMADAKVFSLPVYSGGPESSRPEGRDFCASADGLSWSWSR